jgi:hypothetical protein
MSQGQGDKPQWNLKSASDVGKALEWLRWRSEGGALVLLAIGRNSISYAKHPDVSAADAIEFIEQELHNLKLGLALLDRERLTRGSRPKREF